MDITDLKRVIQDQESEREETLSHGIIVNREIGNEKILRALEHPNIVVIVGVRRCGKSTLSMLALRDKKPASINFDDESLYNLKVDDLNRILDAFYELHGSFEYIVLDEIQNIKGWELFINRLGRTKRVVITGSNSQLLSGELATHLTGRYTEINLMPFSFQEFLTYNAVDIEKIKSGEFSTKGIASVIGYLEEYITKGGFPESYKFGKERIKTTFRDIIAKDIVGRHSIKDPKVIENVAKYLISNFSKEVSYSKLAGYFDIGKATTIKKYLGYISDAFLLFVLERYSPKLKEQVIAPKKIYCIDTGLINAMAFVTSENIGRLMENIVCTELFREKSYSNADLEVFYWKDYMQREVDFVLKKGKSVKELIQVTYANTKDQINGREIASLLAASKELGCKKLLMLTWRYDDVIEKKGVSIRCKPLWKWLLKI